MNRNYIVQVVRVERPTFGFRHRNGPLDKFRKKRKWSWDVYEMEMGTSSWNPVELAES